MKIGCDLNLSGEGLPSWVIRGKSYSHTRMHTHTQILHGLHDLHMLLTLCCYAPVSDLSLTKQKITDLVSELKISFFPQSQQLGSRLVLFFPLCLKKLLLSYLSAGICPEAPQTHLYLVDQSPNV